MSDAVDLMLGVFRAPGRSAILRTRELPDDLLDVIRIAAGDEHAIAAASAATALAPDDLGTAADLLLRNLLFFDGADSYRTLGVRQDADPAHIKTHYRWLVRGLHPDRNPDRMHSIFVDRINGAWNSIRTPERRSRYDASMRVAPDADSAVTVVDNASRRPQWTDGALTPLLSAHAVRRLPQIILFGTGSIALAALCLMAWIASLDDDPALLPPPASDMPRTQPAELRATPVSTVISAATAPASDSPSPPPVSAGPTPPRAAVARAPVAEIARHKPAPIVASSTAVPPSRESARVAEVPQHTPAALSDDDLRDFVERFQRLYAADDVALFLALFSAQAHGNTGGYADLASDYRHLFERRPLRRLNLSELRWEIDGDRAAGSGSYEAWVGPSAGKPESRTRGQILLQLTRGDDGMRITRLNHTVAH